MTSRSTEMLGSLFGKGRKEIGIPNTHGLLGKVRRAKKAAEENRLILPHWEERISEIRPFGVTDGGFEWSHASEKASDTLNQRVSINGIYGRLGADEIIALTYTIFWPEVKQDPNILEVSRIQAIESDFTPVHPVVFFNFRKMVGISPEESLHVAGFPDFSNGQLYPALMDFLSLKTVNREVHKILRDAMERYEKGTLRTIDIREITEGVKVSHPVFLHPFQEKVDTPELK